jgi:hypothetical protein
LLAAQVRREKEAIGPNYMFVPVLTPMGATAFAGGRLRSEEVFDVLIQCFANVATGLGLFEDPYTDDPGLYLWMAQAISIAADFEDVIFNGTTTAQVATVHSDNAVGSSITLGQRSFIAISPDNIYLTCGTATPPISQVDVS